MEPPATPAASHLRRRVSGRIDSSTDASSSICHLRPVGLPSLGSSAASMSADPFVELAAYLTASEAEALAVQFENGDHLTSALSAVALVRRPDTKALLVAAGL